MSDENQIESEDTPDFNSVEPDYTEIVEERTSERVEEEAPAETTPPAAEASAPEPVSSAPTAEPTAPSSPPAAAEETPAAAPPTSALPEAPASMSPEQQKEYYEKMLVEVDKALQAQYAYDPKAAEQLDELAAKPSEYLPQLAARLHRQVYLQAMQSFAQQVPQMVQQAMQQRQVESSAENTFFERWPELKGKDEVVVSAIRAFRQTNPKVTDQKTIIERAGALAMINSGLNPTGTPQPPAARPQGFQPPRPAMPGAGGPGAAGGEREPSYEEKVFADLVSEHFNS